MKLESKSPEYLGQLARDIATNLVFTSRHIRSVDLQFISSIFMPIVLGAFSENSKEYVDSIGLIYEYYDKAGPRSINGYPIFFSFAFINHEDTAIVFEKVDKILKAMENV